MRMGYSAEVLVQDVPSPAGSISRYELRVRLGTGSSGAVYKAWDPELERWVALRLIPPGLAGRGEERQPLIREALTVAALEHPNVGPVYDVGEADDGSLFLVSALCEGETLAERSRRGPMRLEGAVVLAAQIAAAVGRAHEHGILHGRLRPSNVWVGADGQVRVVDFGLSSLEERTWRTLRPGAPPPREYLAPELLLGECASPRSDVWALGALFVAMLGRREGLPDDLSRIMERALSPRPADRYPGAGALRDDLRVLRDPSPRPSGRAPGRMPELAGARHLSQYRIGELLGGGGMGVVYRAEDLHLGRMVALKFLAADLAGDAAAKARFLQEARAASALDHPNICTVFEIGETGENQLYLAMPCYEGETLKARIGRGPLPINEALDYALQTAKGLARAHRQGIVHRDVKPANLMITSDGLVKILDFGVAKLSGEASLTRAGVAVGTAAYMAPEQVRGEEVDARADLWSLGVVLYEMVTGRRPFPGDNPEAVRHAVLTREPEPVARLRPDAPPGLERAVRGLLGKSVADRYPTADAVAADLRLLLGVSSSSMPMRMSAPYRPRRALWLALALAASIAMAGLLLRLRQEPAPIQPHVNRLTDQEGSELFPSLSPDGTFFTYARLDGDDYDIFLQRVGGGNPINLTVDSEVDDTQPAYSPDGRWIAFRSSRDGGGLFVMGATGESVRRVTDFGLQPAWSPDSRELAFATEAVRRPLVRTNPSQLWRVEVATGRCRRVYQGDAVQPNWSPDGRRLAFWGIARPGSARVVRTIPASGGTPTDVLKDGFVNWNPVWAPDGRSLYFVSDRGGSMNLWRIPVDQGTGEVRGEPQPVTTPAESFGAFSLSGDGLRVLFASDEMKTSVEWLAFDPVRGRASGERVAVARSAQGIRAAEPSPDGRWIVLDHESPQEDLFVVRSDGTGLRQITADPFRDRSPGWSADGRWILFSSDRTGHYEIWAIRPDGSGLHRVAGMQDADLYEPSASPDGRRLVCGLSTWGASLVDLSHGQAPRTAAPITGRGDDDYVFTARSWSPDGRSLTGSFALRKAMRWVGIGVYSFDSGAFDLLLDRGQRASLVGGNRTLVYLDGGAIHALDRRTGRTWQVAKPPGKTQFVYLSPSRDGRKLYAVRTQDEGDVWISILGQRG
jgi:serine/threonine protein kinase/Tol biopolymer transport system component